MWIVAGSEVKARSHMRGNRVLWGLYRKLLTGNDRYLIGGVTQFMLLCLYIYIYGFPKCYEG